MPLGGRYVGDFVAAAAKLVVKSMVALSGRRQADARRGRVLRRLGYGVLWARSAARSRAALVALARIREALG